MLSADDCTLRSLATTVGQDFLVALTPPFKPEVLEYSAEIKNKYEKFVVLPVANHSAATAAVVWPDGSVEPYTDDYTAGAVLNPLSHCISCCVVAVCCCLFECVIVSRDLPGL